MSLFVYFILHRVIITLSGNLAGLVVCCRSVCQMLTSQLSELMHHLVYYVMSSSFMWDIPSQLQLNAVFEGFMLGLVYSRIQLVAKK